MVTWHQLALIGGGIVVLVIVVAIVLAVMAFLTNAWSD